MRERHPEKRIRRASVSGTWGRPCPRERGRRNALTRPLMTFLRVFLPRLRPIFRSRLLTLVSGGGDISRRNLTLFNRRQIRWREMGLPRVQRGVTFPRPGGAARKRWFLRWWVPRQKLRWEPWWGRWRSFTSVPSQFTVTKVCWRCPRLGMRLLGSTV